MSRTTEAESASAASGASSIITPRQPDDPHQDQHAEPQAFPPRGADLPHQQPAGDNEGGDADAAIGDASGINADSALSVSEFLKYTSPPWLGLSEVEFQGIVAASLPLLSQSLEQWQDVREKLYAGLR